jgi:hypothetical protein
VRSRPVPRSPCRRGGRHDRRRSAGCWPSRRAAPAGRPRRRARRPLRSSSGPGSWPPRGT